jgi:two-component system, OmpR family, response regulator ChvI
MNNNGRILLVVDDEPDITLVFSMGLEDSGFTVDAFNDPLSALESFKEEKKSYDLALLDVNMPKMNGFELYKEIRKLDDKVKVCFVTAFDIRREEEEDDLKAVGTLNDEKPAIIRKPITLDDLVKRVKAELPDS